jgi:hypothetical protein
LKLANCYLSFKNLKILPQRVDGMATSLAGFKTKALMKDAIFVQYAAFKELNPDRFSNFREYCAIHLIAPSPNANMAYGRS